MPNQDWVASKEAALDSQATAMHAAIAADPTSYGSTVSEMTAFGTLCSSFTAARGVCSEPSTATEVATQEKLTIKAQLVAFMRSLGRRIQANPAVTPAMKTAATLPVHQSEPTPTPVPGTRPVAQVKTVIGRNIVVLVTDELTPTKRARPAGYAGYEIFSWVVTDGTTMPPADLEKWRYEGQSTKAEATIGYNGEDVGKTVIIVVRWFNRKGEVGPTSNPVIAVVAGALAA